MLKRGALEKMGKVQATQESEEFLAKVQSLIATEKAFKNLQRVGKSIFSSIKATSPDDASPHNPADDFLVQINGSMVLKKSYDSKRLAFDAAKDRLVTADEAAKTPGKNQAKKEINAKNALEDKDVKKEEYENAKAMLDAAIDELEENRDRQFKTSIDAMCQILNSLKPDWQNLASPTEEKKSSPGHGDDEKDDGANDTNPDLGESGVESQDPAKAENVTNQTDSESD